MDVCVVCGTTTCEFLNYEHLRPIFKDTRAVFPTLRKTSKKGNNMADKFKLVVKNGRTEYKYDAKTGYNKSKTVDLVEEFDTFAQALEEFMYNMNDEYGENQVSLVFVRSKKGKK